MEQVYVMNLWQMGSDRIAVVGDYADQAGNYDGPSYDHILITVL